MTEIIINMTMDDNHNINITNETSSKNVIIDFEKKSLNAAEIYEVLDYSTDCLYNVKSNIDDLDDGNEKDYFSEIVGILVDISKELNNLNSEDTTSKDENIESDNIENQ